VTVLGDSAAEVTARLDDLVPGRLAAAPPPR
jgi:hypothetical protein